MDTARDEILKDVEGDTTSVMDKNIQEASNSLKAIAHPIRLKILCILDNEELSVQEIVQQVGTSQSNISKHLSLLRDKNILDTRKEENKVMYHISNPRMLMLIDTMHKVFCAKL